MQFRYILILACLAGSLFVTSPGARAQLYDVEGTLEYTVKGENSYENSSYFSFRMSVRDCKWMIETTGRPLTTGNHHVYRDSFDGTNVYCLRQTLQGNKVIRSAATVESNNIPLDMSFAEPLWLAYASHCYFKGVTNNRVKPFWKLGDDALRIDGFTLPAKWSLGKLPPYLPDEVEIFSDGFSYSVDKRSGQTQKRPHPTPYDQGYVTAKYKVLQRTNTGDYLLPTEVSFDRLRPVKGGKSKSDLRNTASSHAVATRIVPATAALSFQPQFQRSTLIEDRRVGAGSNVVKRITYRTTNSTVPALDSAIVSTTYDQKLRYVTEQQSRIGKRPPLLIYLLMGLTAAAVTVFLIFDKKTQPKTR